MAGVITNSGRKIILHRLKDTTYSVLAQMKIGISSTTPSATDTDLNNPVPISGTTQIDDCEATTGWTANSTNSVATTTNFYKQGSKALTLIKSAIGSATCSMDKTVTNLGSFASKDLWEFIYISTRGYEKLKASGTALEIRYGTDSSNYYYKQYTKSDLASDWNYLKLNTTNATGTTGSPGTTNMDYFFISYITVNASDTTSADDLVIDDIKVASASNYFKAFASGYPSVDDINLQITCFSVIASTEAIGASLKEVGVFNTDSSPVIFNRDTYTTIEKNSLIEVTYQTIDQMI